METKQLFNIQILPHEANPVFYQRETGIFHTSYLEETAFYSLVQSGNVELVKKCLGVFLEKGIVIGHLSDNPLRQMQYWAVCCITMGTRYAIQGGVEEMTAYNLSDSYIMAIDKMKSCDEIIAYLEKIVIELTLLVKESSHTRFSVEIQRCVNYINKHLHGKISLEELSKVTGYSKSYLSKTFKSQVGKNISEYILCKKVDEAKALLRSKSNQNMIAYYLGFCSQTHFISCFKRECGMTPNQYHKKHKTI